MHPQMAESYARDLIAELTGGPRPQADRDGDIPVAYRDCQCFVRTLEISRDVVVQCFSVVCEIEESPELASALNPINAQLIFGRAFHVGGQVLVEHDIFADDLSMGTLNRGLYFVSEATKVFGPDLVEHFGARLVTVPTPEPPDEDERGGMYL